MNRVVFITAPEIFRDEEYYKPKKVLEDTGIEVITASVKTGELRGRFGFKTTSMLLIQEINPNDFDAIVYIGGNGSVIFFDNHYALKLANDFFKQRKPVSSICIAGVILANAGILKGKKATVFIDGKEALIKGGAIYTGNPLEIDGNIITAKGPDVAEDFGKAILKSLE
ncbi:DJ-1 family protein [Endomicrobiia bacterium]|uniref:Intracellular protease I n=1 Tax=Endomicrobium trichonymphae TaxID=1408204 RepID=B1GZW9_ENDTX|nr:DJ-1/PfpI family protein [Candidatus Endomicrobium trichonymphae]GHT05901.1 DJ-1 family protein [Endomicrobiia bacterium]BAG13801.1 intracellular protease I [Candidatus Endomicrobium trichonymphae]BAV58871.1 putative intracellular protease [Candidatus Endomicrobium trichonymphae]GHT08642.1 DJ-1 family protein [Endomicrobiia bacterium]GHT11769.1 DJ-1 family protein [Endomicrobiia bacterium]